MLHTIFNVKASSLILSGLSILLLSSCKQDKEQQQGITQEQITAMLDSVKTAAKEEAKAEMAEEVEKQSSNESATQESSSSSADNSSSYSSSSSSASRGAAASPAEAAYKAGYRDGMSNHTISRDYYTQNNEKNLKNRYMWACRNVSYGIGEENFSNRSIYDEYRRGFLKGHEDANNALW